MTSLLVSNQLVEIGDVLVAAYIVGALIDRRGECIYAVETRGTDIGGLEIVCRIEIRVIDVGGVGL